MTTTARIATCAVLATAGLAAALVLVRSARGLGLLAYVLFLGALGLVVLLDRVRAALPAAPEFPRAPARAPGGSSRPEQLVAIERRIDLAEASNVDLHVGMRPLVREILAARLAREHGIDLDREPDRAHALIGDGLLWELARPGRRRPERVQGGGLSRRQLEQLVDELEAV